jgi:carnitine-CoA ligase
VRTIASGRSVAALLREPPALVFDGPTGVARYLASEVRERAEAAAGALAAAGIGPGDRVHLHLDNCPEFLFAWFACAGLGAVMVPTNPASTADELRYVLEHSGARLTVAQPDTAEAARDAGATLSTARRARSTRTPGTSRCCTRRARPHARRRCA